MIRVFNSGSRVTRGLMLCLCHLHDFFLNGDSWSDFPGWGIGGWNLDIALSSLIRIRIWRAFGWDVELPVLKYLYGYLYLCFSTILVVVSAFDKKFLTIRRLKLHRNTGTMSFEHNSWSDDFGLLNYNLLCLLNGCFMWLQGQVRRKK